MGCAASSDRSQRVKGANVFCIVCSKDVWATFEALKAIFSICVMFLCSSSPRSAVNFGIVFLGVSVDSG